MTSCRAAAGICWQAEESPESRENRLPMRIFGELPDGVSKIDLKAGSRCAIQAKFSDRGTKNKKERQSRCRIVQHGAEISIGIITNLFSADYRSARQAMASSGFAKLIIPMPSQARRGPKCHRNSSYFNFRCRTIRCRTIRCRTIRCRTIRRRAAQSAQNRPADCACPSLTSRPCPLPSLQFRPFPVPKNEKIQLSSLAVDFPPFRVYNKFVS